MNCTSCGTALPTGAKFCLECGTRTASACTHCGTELPAGAKFCLECGTATGDTAVALSDAPAIRTAERRVTSVLFGDLVGFTSLSEARDPEEVRDLLSRYFDTAREVVARYGGTIEKFIGDAVMAVWGVPTAHEDDAERAVRAGLDLTESIAAFGDSVGAPGLAMRVGVVTGEVAVTLGATDQGMVAGDAVNTAARVQAEADPGTVWVDAQTRGLAGASIDFVDAGVHELKGKAEPVALYSVQAVMRGVAGDRGTDRVQAPLVGRRRESGLIRELLHTTGEEGRPRLVVISGDAGVGKTRLGWELRKYADGLSASMLWHWGRCLAYGDGVAFSALNAAVRSRINVGDDDDEATVRSRLDLSLLEYVPDSDERDWLMPRLAALLLSGTAAYAREDLFAAWLTWFERLAQAEGEQIVWVIDDAHHADDGLLDFIEHLATVARIPLLLVLVTRPELLSRRPQLAALRGASVVGLETLSEPDTAALLDTLVEGLPTDARDELVRRAEGNPLYAIETVRSMLDQGLAVPGPVRTPGALRLADGVSAEQLRALAAPASLQVLVSSRLDRLTPQQRSVLATASVLGQTFTFGGLVALTGIDEPQLQDVLRELIARDLLTTITDRLAADEGRYAFVQTVVRVVAYRTQSRRDRLETHLAAVSFLEAASSADGELGAIIAQHLQDALELVASDDPRTPALRERLLDWLERAARRSGALGAPAQAVSGYRQAIALTNDPTTLVRLRLAAAESALAVADTPVVSELARSIATDAGPAVTPDDRARAAAAVARAVRLTESRSEGWGLLEPYLADDALAEVSPLAVTRLSREIANYAGEQGEAQTELIWAERALTAAEQTGDPVAIVQALNAVAIAALARGQTRVGLAVLDLGMALAREHRLNSPLALALINHASFNLGRDLSSAIDDITEALRCAEQSGETTLAHQSLVVLALTLRLAGRWAEIPPLWDGPFGDGGENIVQTACKLTQQVLRAHARDEASDLAPILAALDAIDHTQDDNYAGIWTRMIPCLHAMITGDARAAAVAARGAIDLTYRLIGLEDDATYHWPMAVDLHVECGDWTGARDILRFVEDADDYRVSPFLVAQSLRLRGTVEANDPESGADDADVERDLREGITALDEFGAVPDCARTQAQLGVWLTRHGRGDEALEHLAAARATFADLGAARWMRELDADLSAAGRLGRTG